MSAPAKILVEWNFDSPDDAWTQTIRVDGIAVKDGCLTGRSVDKDPSVAGPSFEIQVSPYQFVEIRMKCSKDGHGELYYTNSAEGEYKGFRPDWVQTIEYKAGDFQTYRILPFWQALGKIVRIRIDPPEDSEFAIDYIKIAEIEPGTASDPFFENPQWASIGEKRLSPRLDFEAESYPWLTLVARTKDAAPASLQWVTDGLPGLRSYTVMLRPDGQRHAYNIPMEQVADWQGRVRMLGLELSGKTEIEFVGASKTPRGPAEIEIRDFRLKEAINRVGNPAILQAKIINIGGEDSGDLKAYLKDGKTLAVPSLKPGESKPLTWQVTSKKSIAELRITGKGVDMSAKSTLEWDPPVTAKPSSYVPEPKPVRGEVEVGMYYFPGWATYRQWAVLDEFPERRPILGYYREGDPEVADWQIKWMVEHGVTFIVYDWYWSAGGRQLEHGIHKAFFNARYHDKIKFCLLWANHNAPGTSSAEDMVNVTNYWLDNYFLRPDYFKVDGKPVVVIFSPHRLTEDMGLDGVKAAFDKSRDMAKAKGLPGIYLVGCAGPNRGQLAALEAEGYDAASGYNYPSAGDKGKIVAPYDDMVTGYKEIWDSIAEQTTLPYIPVTEPGWDSRPWHGPNARARTGKTPEKFRQMLLNAREFLAKRSPKVILIEAWNEFGEGDYTEPHQEFGFGHVDAIREVFTNAPKEHEDIVPQDVGLGPYELEKPKPVTAWEFDDPASPGWDPSQNLTGGKVENGCLTAVSNGIDPAIYSGITEVQASKYPAIEIRMKVDKGRGAQLFWAPHGKGFVELASAKFEIIADGEFHIYRLDLAANPAWKSTITAFRLDPTDAKDAHISLDYVRLISR